ncbi:uncharacterized protein [Nicotiana sylvestris]|uniref:uncharacterized protein n=1 Tax=Nicotiana sylvestris TaxID=4096 RepID=UPI00388C3FBC
MRDDSDKWDWHPQCDGAFSGTERTCVFEERVSSEPVVLGVSDSRTIVPSSEYVLPKAYDRLRSQMLRQGARLRKVLDEGESLRLLSKKKELQKNTEAMEYLKGDIDRVRNACGELRAQVRAQALEETCTLAKVPDFESQLRLAQDNAIVQADMIGKLKSDLSNIRDEIIGALAEAALSRTKANQEMAIHMKDTADAQDELKRALDREKRIEGYVRCRSRREVLEEIGSRGFVLSEELAWARVDERDTRSLLANVAESESDKM